MKFPFAFVLVLFFSLIVSVGDTFAQAGGFAVGDGTTAINNNTPLGAPAANAVNPAGVAWVQGSAGGTPIPVVPGVQATPAHNYGTLAFGSVTTASFTTLVTNAGAGRILELNNGLDVGVVVSTDATNNAWTVPASSILVIDLREAGLQVTSNISVKALVSNAASGNIYGTVTF